MLQKHVRSSLLDFRSFSLSVCVCVFFPPLMFALFILRPEDKAMYSPKRSTKPENKDGGQPIEESEILISKAPRKTTEPSLFLALCRTFGPYFLVSTIYKIVHDVLMFSGPEILR